MLLKASVVVLVAWMFWLPPLARADHKRGERIEHVGGATVIKVDSATKVTINRGKKGGLKVGDAGELVPLNYDPATQSNDFKGTRIARGRVVQIDDATATLALTGISETVELGTYFMYSMRVPDSLVDSALFSVVAMGIGLLSLDQKPFITVEEMLADPSEGLRNKVLDAMVADIKAARAQLVDAIKTPVQSGSYHGQTAGQVVDQLDRDKLLECFLRVEANPATYVGHDFMVARIYLQWIYNGAKSGQRDRDLDRLWPTLKAAQSAASRGKLDEARALWQTVLKKVPDSEVALAGVADIDRILLLTRTVAADPDDTASGYELADKLFELGAYDMAWKQTEPLRKRRYNPLQVDRLRAHILLTQKKYQEAEVALKALLKVDPDNKEVADWLVRANGGRRIANAPKDPAAHMQFAVALMAEGKWEAARAEYEEVVDLDRTTAKQLETAKRAQEEIVLLETIDSHVALTRDNIKEHNIREARERLDLLMGLVKRVRSETRQTVLAELGELARSSAEEELALELFTDRLTSEPASMRAHTALASALLGFDRLDEAKTAAEKSLDQKGDPASSYAILAQIARARGDLAEMEKLANKALAKSPTYAEPLPLLASAAAARGDWQDAVDLAKKALKLDPDDVEIRRTLTVTSRGLQAQEALRPTPTSPRERLRLVRALADLGLVQRVGEEIAKLPADGTWRADGWAALAASGTRMPLKDRLAAARNAKPTTAIGKLRLELFEAKTTLRSNPKDDPTRIKLASLYLKNEQFDDCLATLGPLMTQAPVAAVSDLVADARQGIAMTAQQRLASDALQRDDLDTAMRLVLEVLKLHDRIGSAHSRLAARNVRAEVLARRARFPEAFAVLDEARAIAVALGDPLVITAVGYAIGNLQSQVGTNDARRKALEEYRKSCEDQDDERGCYGAFLTLGQLEREDGRAALALEYARKAWAIAELLGDPAAARDARYEVAAANLSLNHFADAELIATKLLADCRKATDIINEQYTLLVLGRVQLMRGQGKQARVRFHEVYDLGTRTGVTTRRALARSLEGHAWLQADHDTAQAALAFEQATELYRSLGDGSARTSVADSLRDLADARLQAGKLGPAREAAEQALALAQRFQRTPAMASSYWMLAMIAIKEGKADVGLTRATAALAEAQKTDSADLLWSTWYAVAKAHELKKHDALAIDAYEMALQFVGRALQSAGGETDQQAYMNLGRVRDVYRDAVASLLAAGKTTRAMEVLELSRDVLLKQQFDPTKISTKDAKLRGRLDTYDEKRSRVKGLQKQLDRAMDKPVAERSESQVKALSQRIAQTRQEMNQVVLDLKATHRQLFQALAISPQNLDGRKADLPKGSVLVEYFVADDALYAFVISQSLTQPAVVRVKVTSKDLEQTVADWRAAIVAENQKMKQRDKVEELGRKLEDWLLEPLRPHLTGASSVILLPFGSLYYVPFDALVVSEKGQPLRYAVEDYRLSIQTATTLEQLLKPARPRAFGTLLAVSNPDGSLPGAQAEVARIKAALPDAQILNRKAATVQKFRDIAGNFRYLHLATHGILDVDPRKSYMKMSDGGLTVEMITQLQGLDLANELVVLSACDTAVELGKSTGDELISVAVAFAMAGSPALVASLWEVGDESTAELMATFYKALENGTGDRADALRDAKLNLLRMQRGTSKPFQAPWHWASFQMYGDYRAPAAVAR